MTISIDRASPTGAKKVGLKTAEFAVFMAPAPEHGDLGPVIRCTCCPWITYRNDVRERWIEKIPLYIFSDFSKLKKYCRILLFSMFFLKSFTIDLH